MSLETKPCSCVRPAQCWGGMGEFIICQGLREAEVQRNPLGFWAELANRKRDTDDDE